MVVCGVQMWEPLKKWKLSTILAEELVNFTVVVNNDKMTDLHFEMPSILGKINQGYFQTTNIDTVVSVHSAICLRLICAVCSVEETARYRLKIEKIRHFSHKMKGVAYCNECHMDSHVSVPATSVSQVNVVEIFTYF